jgi:very-short-patch-repair endonuclease
MPISKDDYILRNFSKIQLKKWELYIITRIVHLLNDSEIEFVCQQFIKTRDGKRYLADLCFPSLKLYYEIDEAQHGSDQHKIKDEHRQREIIDATDFIEKRISIFDKNKNDRNINEINKEVDEFIAFVKKRKKQFISKGNFIPWDYETKFSPAPHLKRGYIDVKDNVVFSNHRDALRCFGYKKGHYQRAVWRIKGSNKEVWFPKLYRNNTWNNSLSNDFKKIIMKRNNNAKIKRRKKREFIVFAHYKDLLGQIVYKFLGEFHTLFKESDNYQRAFIRKKTKIYFKDFDV